MLKDTLKQNLEIVPPLTEVLKAHPILKQAVSKADLGILSPVVLGTLSYRGRISKQDLVSFI